MCVDSDPICHATSTKCRLTGPCHLAPRSDCANSRSMQCAQRNVQRCDDRFFSGGSKGFDCDAVESFGSKSGAVPFKSRPTSTATDSQFGQTKSSFKSDIKFTERFTILFPAMHSFIFHHRNCFILLNPSLGIFIAILITSQFWSFSFVSDFS